MMREKSIISCKDIDIKTAIMIIIQILICMMMKAYTVVSLVKVIPLKQNKRIDWKTKTKL